MSEETNPVVVRKHKLARGAFAIAVTAIVAFWAYAVYQLAGAP